MKRIMTIDDLYQFFSNKNETMSFSASDSGSPIVVDVPAIFEYDKDSMRGLMTSKIKVCHTLLNRKNVFISEENMKVAMGSLKYRPILAYIHTLPNGELDFFKHNYEVVQKDDGSQEMVYLEKQVGCMTADEPYLEYDEEQNKTYVVGFGIIPEEYTEAANIIRRKDGTKVSCELVIESCSYNASNKYLELGDFYFGGVTLLGCDENGTEIREGMAGSRLDIQDFCHDDADVKIDEMLQSVLGRVYERFDNMIKEGGNFMDKEKFETEPKTEDPVVEEPEAGQEQMACKPKKKCDEEMACKPKKKCEEEDGESDNTEDPEVEEEPKVEEEMACGPKRKRCSIDEESGNMVVTYELSHDDIRYGLYELLYERYDESFYYVEEVFDEYCIFKMDNRYFKIGYSKDGDNLTLTGDSVEVFAEYLTQAEKDALAEMRQNYSDYKAFKEEYDAAEKAKVFDRVEYSDIKDNEEFTELQNDYASYSMDELEAKCNAILVKHIKASKFSDEDPVSHSVRRTLQPSKSKKAQAYSGLFDE